MAATGTSASTGPGIGAGDRVIVTGAAGGLASPAVARLRERRVQVIGLDVIGDEHTIACDITDDAAVSRAVAEAVQRLGGFDAVVHFAGIGIPNDAGRQVGLALEGQVRREEVEDVVATVLRALTAARPRRETACTRGGAVELWVGRHLPGVLGPAVARRIRRRAAAGHFDGSTVAAGLVRRLTGRANASATSTDTAAPATERSPS